MTLEELQRRARTLQQEALTLTTALAGGSITDEQRARIGPLTEELRQTNDEIETRQRALADLNAQMQRGLEPAGQVPGVTPTTQRDGEGPSQTRVGRSSNGMEGIQADSIRDMLASEQWRAYAQGGGRGQSQRFLVPNPHWEAAEVRDAGYIPSQARAVFSNADNAGVASNQRLPGITRQTGARFLRVRDLMNQGRSDSPIIELLIELSRTNNAAPVAESTTSTPVNKPESGFATQIKQFPMSTIAHWTEATRQSLHNNAFLESYLAELLREGIADVEDLQIIAGNGTAPNVRGIKNTSGINNLNSAYWTANPLPAGGTKLDRLRRARTVVGLASRRRVDGIVLSPAVLEEFETMKDSSGKYLLQRGGPDGSGVTTLWGIPVSEQEDLGANEAIVASWQTMWVFDNMDVALYATDSHASRFVQNIITFLAEEYIHFVPTVPSAIAVVALA